MTTMQSALKTKNNKNTSKHKIKTLSKNNSGYAPECTYNNIDL